MTVLVTSKLTKNGPHVALTLDGSLDGIPNPSDLPEKRTSLFLNYEIVTVLLKELSKDIQGSTLELLSLVSPNVVVQCSVF